MTPAARVATAIEILGDVLAAMESDGASADVILKAAFRARRYAGSKDRAAVSELVYGVLRRRGLLGWRLQEAGAEMTARALMIAAIVADNADINAVFSGGGYGPEPLSEDEVTLAKRLGENVDAPLWVRCEIPQWLVPEFEWRFGDHIFTEAQALNQRAPLDIRVNVKRLSVDDARQKLHHEGIATTPLKHSPMGLRAEAGAKVTATSLYRDGLIEIQDEAAQAASLMVVPVDGGLVVDLCAGAGGKSLAIAAAATAPIIIDAFDIDERRLNELSARADRAGAANITATLLPESGEERAKILAPFMGKADVVVVDAPCSGTGTWRRNPELRWRLTPERSTALTELQSQLIREAAALVKPGGKLFYMTCSVLMREDEDIVNAFLAGYSEFTLMAEKLSTPARDGTDGFYVAVMMRKE